MGYPSYVKLIGMTESKRLILRKTLTMNAPIASESDYTDGKTPITNVFQIVLNPMECPNISKAFVNQVSFEGKDKKTEYYNRVFKYDYLRIKNIFISIKPAQNVSNNSGGQDGTGLYDGSGDSPISNVYAYFTYRYPILGVNDESEQIQNMYGTNPYYDRIKVEGRLKNTYSWPSNKAITISLNKLMYRVNTDPYRIFPNAPLDLQFLNTLNFERDGVYDPFGFDDGNIIHKGEKGDIKNNDNEETSEVNNLGVDYNYDSYGEAVIPDIKSANTNLFFGRLVIVSPKHLRFTAEICYDCVLLR